MKQRITLIYLFACACLVSATTIIPVSIERLTSESSEVVEARALSAWSQWNPQHSHIYTYTRFQVQRSLKGRVLGVVVVRQIGGSAEGYTQRVAGVRHWRMGEQAVLFLRPSENADSTYEVTGLMQGNFLVSQDSTGASTVSNGVTGVTSFDPSSHQTALYQGSRMKLEDLESRVRKAAGQ